MLIRRREIGGSIGAGLFVGTGPGFHNGGPGSVVNTKTFSLAAQSAEYTYIAARLPDHRRHDAFHYSSSRRARGSVSRQWRLLSIHVSLLRPCLVCGCLAHRFVERDFLVDMARGFAIGWDYAVSWLTILPFELIAAGLTISFWRSDINVGIWITIFLVVLIGIQFFGVRGYGEGKVYYILDYTIT